MTDAPEAGTPTPPPAWDGASPSTGSGRSGRSKSTLVFAILAIVVLIGAVAAVAFVFKDGNPLEPEDLAWPEEVGGRPAGLGEVNVGAAEVAVDAPAGVYAWSDFDGWHLWVVNGGDLAGLTGTITSDKDFSGATSAIEGAGTVTREGSTISFDLPADPQLVGIDFNTGFYGKDLTFDLQSDSGPVDVALIRTGAGEGNPVAANPFTVTKVAAPN